MERPGERVVTLHDGRQVSNYSEEWRHECEARTVVMWKGLRRRQNYLWGTLNEWNKYSGGVQQIRGEAECKRLEATMAALWPILRGDTNNKPKDSR